MAHQAATPTNSPCLPINPMPWTSVRTSFRQAPSGNWSSSNSSVATVVSGFVTGIAAGSTTIGVSDQYSEPTYTANFCGYNLPSCPVQPATPPGAQGSGTVVDSTPTITGIAPSNWIAGATAQVTFTGQYFGTNTPTVSFSPSAGITYSLLSYNDTQITASVTVASGTPNEQVAITVTNNGYGGQSFNGGQVGQSANSSPAYASVRAPASAQEVTVIAWVNGQAPDLVTLPFGANQSLVTNLNNTSTTCGVEVGLWIAGIPVDLYNATDQAYANDWLVKYSANPAPPNTITPSAQRTAGNFRLINDFGANGGFYQVGKTPDPCGVKFPGLNTVVDWLSKGEASQYMGAYGVSASGKIYVLAEGRVGTAGQKGSATINGGRTVPWIWSVIEFDSSGNATYSDVAVFPTYSVYVNGTLIATYPQTTVAAFVAKDQTYQRTPSQIQ